MKREQSSSSAQMSMFPFDTAIKDYSLRDRWLAWTRVEAMTKSELIEQISLSKGLSKTVTEQAVNMVFDRLAEALVRNERVEIRGFGSFEIRRYGSYKGRNPRTGSAVIVRPKRLPFFKPGKEMKDLVNTNLRRTSDHSAVLEVMPVPLTAKNQ